MDLRIVSFILFVALTVVMTDPKPVAADETASSLVRPVAMRRNGDERASGDRQREGSRVSEVTGRFEISGDRVTFFPAGGRESFRLLENLALERVATVLSESRARQEWTVSGTLTEFRGANYLLLTKAVIKSTTEAK